MGGVDSRVRKRVFEYMRVLESELVRERKLRKSLQRKVEDLEKRIDELLTELGGKT